MNKCDTKYPIVLVHGIGYSDEEFPDYWGDVPENLRSEGAKVFFGRQAAFGSIEESGEELLENVEKICLENDAEKVNIIAHSKGGLDARYMISVLGGEERVASLTTIATPHHGIAVLDEMGKKPFGQLNRFYNFFNMVLRISGGQVPESNSAYEQMSADYMEVFNEMVPDSPRVYYQSYACEMKSSLADPVFARFHRIVTRKHGKNDGLVPVESAKWGDFRGAYTGPSSDGVSHSMVCGNRKPLSWKKGGYDVTEFYVDMVARLKHLGY